MDFCAAATTTFFGRGPELRTSLAVPSAHQDFSLMSSPHQSEQPPVEVLPPESADEQLRRAHRMASLGLIATRVAHDLNNMLSPMLLAAPMLRGSVSDPAAQRLLETLEATVVRATALVRQILDYSLDAPAKEERVGLQHLLREIVSFAAETFPENIRVESAVAADLWPVRANLGQLHQVLLNLCVNARDAMPQGGTLRLGARNFRLDAKAAAAIDGGRAGTFLLLTVEDNGTGFSPDVTARLWQPFVTTKKAGNGRGLGLSTVRGIVAEHGGFIELHTRTNEGSTFYLYLPAAAALTEVDERRVRNVAVPVVKASS